ncbi:MAG: hypothetical protein K0U36_02245, partial [Alphaproteobacteria bacterium]|nr:hypothetical protein [Alphaproteobacteria bacterium]
MPLALLIGSFFAAIIVSLGSQNSIERASLEEQKKLLDELIELRHAALVLRVEAIRDQVFLLRDLGTLGEVVAEFQYVFDSYATDNLESFYN